MNESGLRRSDRERGEREAAEALERLRRRGDGLNAARPWPVIAMPTDFFGVKEDDYEN